LSRTRRAPTSPLFPYTTLFRSNRAVGILAGILGDQHVLYVKTRNYHWNITGPHFNELHAFFEQQYNEIGTWIDETAERIRMLGRSEEHTSELQSRENIVCRLLL